LLNSTIKLVDIHISNKAEAYSFIKRTFIVQ